MVLREDPAETDSYLRFFYRSRQHRNTMPRRYRLLRSAYLVGAITDALAVIALSDARVAEVLWHFTDASPQYQFVAGYAAALMFGWTALLVWAYQRPAERRAVAGLTILVIVGFVLSELVTVARGTIKPEGMVATWCLQAILLGLFVVGLRDSRS